MFNNNDLIKSIVQNGEITTNYKYNSIGEIEESEGTYFYHRYIYDNENKLIEVETAVSPSLFSSSLPTDNTELLTADNNSISRRQVFRYDENGNLLEIESYFRKEAEFEFSSINSVEFASSKIIRRNLHNENGEITQFYVYEYDKNGNVKNEKYYTYVFSESSEPRLITETSYKFDDKKNPFKILNQMGIPGLYTNSNNIIETNLTRHEEVPGFGKYSTSTISYEYNRNDYPIMVLDDSMCEYRY